MREKLTSTSIEGMKKVHENLHHKDEEQLVLAFRDANKLDQTVRKNISRVTSNCQIQEVKIFTKVSSIHSQGF